MTNNSSSLGPFENRIDRTGFDAIYVTFSVVLIILTCTGNALVITAVGKFKDLQSVTNIFIASLAINDMLIGLVTIPCNIVLSLNSNFWKSTSTYYAYLFMYLSMITSITLSASIAFILLIALERHTAIFSPFFYSANCTVRRAIILSGSVFGFVFGWNLLLFTSGQPDFTPRVVAYKVDVKLFNMTYFIIVTLAITIIHVKISVEARRHKRRIAALTVTNHAASNKMKRDSRIMKMLTIVLGCFYAFWLPHAIGLELMDSLYGTYVVSIETVPLWFYIFSVFSTHLAYANSIVNPIVYALTNKDFRRAFKTIALRNSSNTYDSSSTIPN